MAALASIPEGGTSLHNSRFRRLNHDSNKSPEHNKSKQKPFLATKRHSRVRYSNRPVSHRTSWAHNQTDSSDLWNDTSVTGDLTSGPAPASSSKDSGNIYGQPYSKDHYHDDIDPYNQKSARLDEPLDLDSFPVPPSSDGGPQSGNQLERNKIIHKRLDDIQSASIRKLAQVCAATNIHKANSPLKAAHTASRRSQFVDGAHDSYSSSHHSSIDSALVDAVSRNVLQQFQLLSMGNPGKGISDRRAEQSAAPGDDQNQSRTASQKDALDRFTKDLSKHAEKAKGRQKPPTPTPGTSKSGGTLNTVSALVPFRSEFEVAGLAVTSKDQAKRIPSYITKAVAARPKKTAAHQGNQNAQVSRFDGLDDLGESSSPNTEISFTHPKDMDEWRFALVDEDPVAKKKNKKNRQVANGGKKSKRRCFDCFRASPSLTPDPDWAHFRPRTSKVPALRNGIGPPPAVPPPKAPPRPPRPAVGLFDPEPSAPADHGMPNTRSDFPQPSHAISPRMLPPRKASKHPRSRANKSHMAPELRRDALGKQREEAKSRAHTAGFPAAIPDPIVSLQYKRTLRSVPQNRSRQSLKSRRRSTRPRRREDRNSLAFDPDHVGICCRSNRSIPSRANARPNIPRRTSSMQRLMKSGRLDFDDREITDRDVLRGLHIAASAACDEEVDAYVRNKTGLRIRRFLADLMALETLGERLEDEDMDQWARRRRAEMRKLKQQLRRSREINAAGII